MNVTLVSSSSGSRGGGEFYLVGLAEGLRQAGHVVRVLMSDASAMDGLSELLLASEIESRRISYTNTYSRWFRAVGAVLDRKSAPGLAEELLRDDPDVIHLNHQNVEDGLDLLAAAGLAGRPVVSTVHVTRSMADLGARAGRLRDAVARRAFRQHATPCIGISETSAIDLSNFLGVRPPIRLYNSESSVPQHQPVYAVPNGVRPPVQLDRAAVRSAWGISADNIVLGCVARLEHQKNPLFLCRLLPELPDEVRVVWVGDGRLRPELEAELARTGLSHRVVLDGWRTDAAARLAAMDIFFLPSLYEGLPLALLEAMSLGLPCVVSDVDGTRDAVEDGVSGRLCPVDDLSAWRAAVLELVESPQRRAAMGQAAARRHAAEFSIERMAERTADVYRDVIARAQAETA